jgi:hypothetical protein
MCFIGLPDKIDIRPPADTMPDPWHSTPNQRSLCLQGTKSHHLKRIVFSIV